MRDLSWVSPPPRGEIHEQQVRLFLFFHQVAVAPVSHHYSLEPQQIENEITVNLLRE